MLFVCDIGNSKIKSAFFKDERISGLRIFDDIDSLLEFVSNKKISGAAVSSVVPDKLRSFQKGFNSRFGYKPLIINKNVKFNLKIDYKTPGTLGIDRICSAEGAFYLYHLSYRAYNRAVIIISVDFGTATTINIIKYNGIFAGGLILPGVKMMFKSLKNETAQLPEVKPSEYLDVIGSSTKSSIASGVINATVGAITQTINYLRQNNKTDIKIFATGGNAGFILPYLKYQHVYEKGLVLYGIKSVYDNNLSTW